MGGHGSSGRCKEADRSAIPPSSPFPLGPPAGSVILAPLVLPVWNSAMFFCVDCLTLPMKFRPSDLPHGPAGRRICLSIAPRGLFVAGCDCGWGDARPTDPVSVVVFVRSLCGFCVDGVDFAAWHSFAATGPDEDRPFASLRRGLLLCVARILPQVCAGIAAGYGRRCCCDPGQCDMRMVVAGNPIAFPARISVPRRLVAGRRGADGDDRIRRDIAIVGRRHAPQDPG